MTARQSFTIEEIKDRLLAQIDKVVHHYAPPVSGSYTDKGRYFTLNPGRADRSVGSFVVAVSGPRAGRWNDYATGQKGDLVDLIALSLGLSLPEAFREARAFLGLEHETPEIRRIRDKAAAEARARRLEAERDAAEQARKRSRQALAIWLSAEPQIAGTPVEHYLRGRCIDLRALGRQPAALRYLRSCTYHSEVEDPETGEIHEVKLRLPAMVAAIDNGRGETVAVHRTYLAIGQDGRWGKAQITNPVAPGKFLEPKKVLGDYRAARIVLSSGHGPRGGKGCPLSKCPPGTRVYIAEGIETALSAVILKPEARVLAAISVSNMGQVHLPPNVAEVVLIADGDEHPQAVAQLDAAVKTHAAKGRRVRCWRSEIPGEDLNDALQRAMKEQGAE
ncbi:hypothetical protein D1122_01445 [Cereibacter sphaeroides]|uniref:DUF7146 domain-containing protein n=1 Tax=Cereibacter sphaeroides TaxID=1063 RepID=UPI000E5A5435|nr:toprim domain-containing protein [Cereibacter sphaeroides]RIA01353.1 hypothetical protein D1122_01445 [Cereibacter sphaeroides]